MKKHLGFLFNVIAIILFIPGIVLPMLSFKMDMKAGVAGASLHNTLVDKNLSLIHTIEELWLDERILVALLIFAFSICIPVFKFILASVAYVKKNTDIEQKIYRFISTIGKWSMADVFVVAIFLAVLSTNHAETLNQQQIAILGFKMELLISSETLSALGEGFYYFTGYCLLSLFGTTLSQMSVK